METTLHILCAEPDEMVANLIEIMTEDKWITVVSLYEDDLSHRSVDWSRLVDDIFDHEKVICWL